MIAYEIIGTGPRVALLHGFTQNRRCWPVLADDLASDHEVVLVDLPGHGAAASVAAPLEDAAVTLADEIGPAVWVGYSMGGRHALRLAVHHREVVQGLVTIGATAGLSDPESRTDRRAADEDRALDLMLRGLPDFLNDWMKLPLFDGIPDAHQCREERLSNHVEGLVSSLFLAGTGAQESLWDQLDRATAPLVAVAGADDTKFVDLGEKLVAEWGGSARLEVVPGSTHAVQLIDPAAVAAAVRSVTDATR